MSISSHEQQPRQNESKPHSPIWTRRNIILFTIVVVQGAIIFAYMIFVALLFAFPNLRERVMPSKNTGAVVVEQLTSSQFLHRFPANDSCEHTWW
jgi:hypothetical protein